jgi:hypothetical protein
MQRRRAFARLLPLIELIGMVAVLVALLALDRPRPERVPAQGWGPAANPAPPPHDSVTFRNDGGCSDVPAPVPSHRLVDSAGRLWELANLRGREGDGMKLAGALWFWVILRGSTFTACVFRGADLRQADLADSSLWECDLSGADFTDANPTGASSDLFTRWPSGFSLQEHGTRLEG